MSTTLPVVFLSRDEDIEVIIWSVFERFKEQVDLLIIIFVSNIAADTFLCFEGKGE